MAKREDVGVKIGATAAEQLDMLCEEWEARIGASMTRKGMLGMLVRQRYDELRGRGILPDKE